LRVFCEVLFGRGCAVNAAIVVAVSSAQSESGAHSGVDCDDVAIRSFFVTVPVVARL
jgi:hypothetical protein